MRGKIRLSFLFVLFLAVVLPGCQQTINYPTPTISAISPTSIQAAQPTFVLTVTGGNFTPASSVGWNGATLSSIFVSTNTLTVQVPASLIQNPGTAKITRFHAHSGRGNHDSAHVHDQSEPQPHAVHYLDFALICARRVGGNHARSAGHEFCGAVGGDAGQHSAVNGLRGTNIPASLGAGEQSGHRRNDSAYRGESRTDPSPGGGSSNTFSFNIDNPVPSITSLSPATIAAGGAATNLSISGSGIASDAVVLVNGAPHTTSAGNTSAVIILSSGDLSAGGIALVQVVNPGPGGGTSNTLTLAIDPTDTAGLPILVDYAPDGTQANAGICGGLLSCQNDSLGLTLTTSGPSASSTGQFIAFASVSSNLVTNLSSAASQIFVRDTCIGQTCAPLTFLGSITYNGVAGNGASSEPSLDDSGTELAYTSLATNLVNYVPGQWGYAPDLLAARLRAGSHHHRIEFDDYRSGLQHFHFNFLWH